MRDGFWALEKLANIIAKKLTGGNGMESDVPEGFTLRFLELGPKSIFLNIDSLGKSDPPIIYNQNDQAFARNDPESSK